MCQSVNCRYILVGTACADIDHDAFITNSVTCVNHAIFITDL